MTEEEARLTLLQTELNAIQGAIRSLDTIEFQIKGWCVTVSLAIGGFAAAYHRPILLLVGAGAVGGFWLINCQSKMWQRSFILHNLKLESELKATGIMEVLRGNGHFDIVGTASPDLQNLEFRLSRRIRGKLPGFLAAVRSPSVFAIYLFILACLITEAIILS